MRSAQGRICYSERLGWLFYDGQRWQSEEAKAQVEELAKRVVREIASEAKALKSWAKASESRAHLSAMVTLAESKVNVRPGAFDRDPWLLNCTNGTLDLRNGELHPHRPEDLITKITNVAYDPEVNAPQFQAFLDNVQPDRDTRNYLLKATGYASSGSVSEDEMYFNYGSGANGKSTYFLAVSWVLGDYAQSADPELLVVRRNAHPTSVADLQGSRLVTVMETEEGQALAVALMKRLTGGDTQKARRMHKDFFEFDPTAKIFWFGNHRPVVRGTDHGTWRRIRLIPWNTTIPEDEQADREELMKVFRSEGSGILNLITQACQDWQANGLEPPSSVVLATGSYRMEQDILGAFIDECCATEGDVGARHLYQSYRYWSDETGQRIMTEKMFSMRLEDRGYEKRRSEDNGARRWFGLSVKISARNPFTTVGGDE